MSGTVTGTSTSSTSSASTSAAAKSTVTFGNDFNTFLKMLTTQLQNQDPTKAMDTTEMTNQLVAFSQVEQQISMNTNLEKLIGLQQASEVTSAQGLLGKTVEVEADQLALQGGKATLVLPAAGSASTATVTVLNSAGQVLRTQEVPLTASSQTWSWDGKTTSGTQLPDGAYRFAVAGRDTTGSPQTVTATVRAQVTAAERQGTAGDLKLVMGGLMVPFDAVRRVVN